MLKIRLIRKGAKAPTRGSVEAAGLDLYAASSVNLLPGRELIPCGFEMSLPVGMVGLIWPRSGMACKGLTVDAGVIDSDYRGEVKVLLVNNSGVTQRINAGDRIAQMLIQRVEMCEPVITEELDETGRGDSGFGSTGGHSDAPPPQSTPNDGADTQ